MPAFLAPTDFLLIDDQDQTKVVRFDVSALTSGSIVTMKIPNIPASGGFSRTVAMTDVSTQTFTAQQNFNAGLTAVPPASGLGNIALLVYDSTSSNQVFAVDGDGKVYLTADGGTFGSSQSVRLDMSLLVTATLRNQKFQDTNGSFVLVGNASSPGSGEIGKKDLTAQSAAIGSTNLTNASPAGYYVVHYTLETTATDAGAPTIQFQVGYTDDIGATTQTGTAIDMSTNTRDRGSFQVYLASGNITYQTNLTGSIGAARYALRVRVEYLG